MSASVQPAGPREGNVAERVWRWVTWQRVPVERMTIRRLGPELAALLTFAVVYVGFSAATGLLIRRHPMPILGARYFTDDYQYVFLFKTFGMLVLPAAGFFARGYCVRDLLPEWRWERRTILYTVFGFVAGVAVNAHYIGELRAIIPQMATLQVVVRLAWGVAIPLFNAGIPEEFVYRGLLQTRLEAAAGRLVAIFGTAVLFTAWHLPTRYLLAQGTEGHAGNFASVLHGTGLPVFFVGLILGVLWDRYRRLIPLIALHWGVDLLPLTAAMFGVVS